MDVEATSTITSCRTHNMTDLNTSDNLPVTASLVYPEFVQENHNVYVSTLSRIDWGEAEKTGATLLFASDVRSKLEPLFNGVYDDPMMIGEEIEQVATILQGCSVTRLYPVHCVMMQGCIITQWTRYSHLRMRMGYSEA